MNLALKAPLAVDAPPRAAVRGSAREHTLASVPAIAALELRGVHKGYGHGAARTWLQANAVVGASVTLTEDIVPQPPDGGGSGGSTDLTAVKAAYEAASDALDTLTQKMSALGDAIEAADS